MNIIFFGFYLSLSLVPFYQENNRCDKIYDKVDITAKYTNDHLGLAKYLQKDLIIPLMNCINNDGDTISSMSVVLTIDANGKVIEVDFPKLKASESCKGKLRKQLLGMTGWIPGKVNGKDVCSKYLWTISCINWDTE